MEQFKENRKIVTVNGFANECTNDIKLLHARGG